jgi:hypothetical protein
VYAQSDASCCGGGRVFPSTPSYRAVDDCVALLSIDSDVIPMHAHSITHK